MKYVNNLEARSKGMHKMVRCPECNSIVDIANGACSNCGYPFDDVDELEFINDDSDHSQKQRQETERRIAELEQKLQAEKKQLENLSTNKSNNEDIPQNNKIKLSEYDSKDVADIKEDNSGTHAEKVTAPQAYTTAKKSLPKPLLIVCVVTVMVLLIAIIVFLSGHPVESIELKNKNETVSEGYDLQLEATIVPDDAKNKHLTWSSSDESIATVDSDGIVRGVKPGECFIKVQSNNKKEASCKITVGAVPQKIEFEKDSYNITINDKKTVKYEIEPNDVLDDSVTWKSDDDSIVSIDSEGQLTAKKTGTTEITISTFNGISDTCKINVCTPTPTPTPTLPPKKPLETVYDYFCDPSYATLASDGSCLMIDTKPNDNESEESEEAIKAVGSILYLLDFPESVVYKMQRTNALAGIQSEVHNSYRVSWTYHPDNGLEVMFEMV